MSNSFEPDSSWERVASELRACRDSQQAAWGNIDNATLGRYLANEVTGEERQRIEQAMQDLPELRMLTDLVRDVLTEFEPVPASVPTPVPVTLSFAEHAARRAAARPTRQQGMFGKKFRQRAMLAAAAGLLLALGLSLHGLSQSGSPLPRSGVVAMAPGQASHAFNAPNPPLFVSVNKPAEKGAAAPPMMQLAQLDRQVEALQTQGRFHEALALAGQLPALAKQAQLDESPRYADSLNRVGNLYEKRGDLAQASANYAQALTICQNKLGAEDPATVKALNLLANTYQVALNQAPRLSDTYAGGAGHQAPHATISPASADPVGQKREDKKVARDAAASLADRIVRQNPREVKQAVVPVLMRGLRHARTPEERVAFIQALSRLGSAARDAVPLLAERLHSSRDATECHAILTALGEMGPSAENALPVLVESLKSTDPAMRSRASASMLRYGPEGLTTLSNLAALGDPKVQEQARDVLRRGLSQQEACVGVKDGCDLFSVQAVNESQRDMLALVRNNGPALYITSATDKEGQARAESDKDIRKLMEIEGVTLVLSREGQVEIRVSEALQQRGFTLNKQSELQALLEKHLKNRDYDAALRECVQFVTGLNLRPTKKAGSERKSITPG